MKTFNPEYNVVGTMLDYSLDVVKNETMLHAADRDFALANGNTITRDFVNEFLSPNKDWLIDTKVHMLMKDWYPCIGGWHLDKIPRNKETGQPDMHDPAFVGDFLLCIIDVGTGSLTEFVDQPITLSEPDSNCISYHHYSTEINKSYNEIQTFQVKANEVVSFNGWSFHRGQPALNRGWRFFIRAGTNIPVKAKNEIRRQSNVYLDTEKGW